MFLCLHHKRMKLLPALLEGKSILLDDSSLLWVDDSGSGHDDGSTFTWCRLEEKKRSNKVKDNQRIHRGKVRGHAEQSLIL